MWPRVLKAGVVGAVLLWSGRAVADESATLPTAINLPGGPGSLEGFGQGYDVSASSGLPSLSYPIALPPGRAGLTPDVTLRYQAGKGSGIAGLGWSLETPCIEVSTRRGIPTYDATDELALRGLGSSEELIQVMPGVFRERIEGSTPVVVRVSGNGYEAVTVDGTRYVFGTRPETRFGGSDGTFRWELEAIVDTFGNRVEFGYIAEAGTDRPLLAGAAWNDGEARVLFSYEARPERLVSRSAGFPDTLAHRLATIETHVAGELVQTWTLGYENAPEVPSSKLVSIASAAADGTALPTWSLRYGAMLAETPEVRGLGDGPQIDPTAPGFSWTDVDGDALPDLLSGESGNWRYRRNRGGDSLDEWASMPLSPSVTVGDTSRFADLDGDGVADLLFQSAAGDSDVWGYLGGGAAPFGTSENVFIATSFDLTADNVALVDLNFDGRVDVLASESADAFVWTRYFEEAGYHDATVVAPLPGGLQLGQPGVSFVDVDGDRLPDLTRVMPEDSRVIVATGEGRGWFGDPEDMTGVPAMNPGERWELRDANGDGASDLLRVGADQIQLWVNQLDGSFAMVRNLDWPTLEADERVVFTDVNANGTLDVLRVDPTGSGGWRYWDLLGIKPGLLTRLENGMGYAIDFTYTSAARQAYEAEEMGEPWATFAPEATPVLAGSTEEDGVDWVREVEHRFRDGWYDPVRGEFRGFAETREIRLAGETVEERHSIQRYDLGQTEEARKLQLVGEELAAPDGTVSRTVHTLEVQEPETGVFVARRVASDTWHLERGPPGEAARVRTEWDHDGWGNVLEQRELGQVDLDTASDVPGDERITTNTYAVGSVDGPRNRLSEVIVADGAGERASASRSYYDGPPEEGAPLGTVEARGALHRQESWIAGDFWVPTLRQAYDVYGNVIRLRDAEGGTLERTYEDLGRFPVQEQTRLDDSSPLDALVVTAEWDARFGQPTRVTSPAGAVTEVAYDGLGRPTAIARPGDDLNRPTVAYQYYLDGARPVPAIRTELRRIHGEDDVEVGVDQLDGLGRLRQRFTQDDDGEGAVLVEAHRYDPDGEVSHSVEGQWAPVAALEPGGLLDLDASWPTAVTWRDAAGRVIEARDADGYQSRETYGPLTVAHRDNEDMAGEAPYADTPRVSVNDGLGRLVEIQDELTDRAVVHGYGWDGADRLLRYIDPAGNETNYGYGGDGRLLTVDSPDAGFIEQRYDRTGRLVERVDARGARVEIDYDILGRILAERGYGLDGEKDSEATYVYDEAREGDKDAKASFAAGQLTGIDDDAGSIDFIHDARGRAVRTTRVFSTSRHGDAVLSYAQEYDAQDRVRREVFPDGTALTHEYGYRGRPRRTGTFVEAWEYDALGRPVEAAYANGTKQTVELDRTGRVLSQRVAGGGADLLHLTHGYDAAGLLGTTTDRLGATKDSVALDQSFGYDDLRRLTSAKAEYGDLKWRYSDDGNLLEHSGRVLNYGGPQPHAATGLDGQTLTYDTAGQLRKVEGEGELPAGRWTFDGHGRVTEFLAEDGARLEHVYDHAGQRAVRREYSASGKLKEETLYFGAAVEVRDGKLVRWVHGAGQRVAEVPKDLPKGGFPRVPVPMMVVGGMLLVDAGRRRGRRRRRGWWRWASVVVLLLAGLLGQMSCRCGGGGGSPPELTPTKTTRFHVQDRLSSAALVLDREGEVVARSAHRPYGEKWVDWRAKGERGPDYRFTDKEEDPVSGAVYIGARHYLPGLGRWGSPDPLALITSPSGFLDDPSQRNPYAYVRNNPVQSFDPNGQYSWESFKADALAYGSKGLDVANDVVSGAVDTVTVGGAKKVRQALDIDMANYDSTAYKVGEVLGEEARDAGIGAATGGVGYIATKINKVRKVVKWANKAAKSKKLKRGTDCLTCFVGGTLVLTPTGLTPIDELEVGDRVWTPESEEFGKTAVDETWRVYELQIEDDASEVGSYFEVKLLRPADWLERVEEDGRVWVQEEEFRLRTWAELVSVAAAPAVGAGPGRVVLTTVSHVTNDVLELGLKGRSETLLVTEGHTLWSEARDGWVDAGTLVPGEEIRTAEGALRVTSAASLAGGHRVFNLEIEGEHVYYVTEVGVVGHNCPAKGVAAGGRAKPSLSAHKEALKKVHKEVGGSLPSGKPGKFGSPQRGTPKKGYRLDPGHPGRPKGDPEAGPHINWWDYTGGKRGSGGRSDAIPIE